MEEKKKPTLVNGKPTGDTTESGNPNHDSKGQFEEKDASSESEEKDDDLFLDSEIEEIDFDLLREIFEDENIEIFGESDEVEEVILDDLDSLINSLEKDESDEELDAFFTEFINKRKIPNFTEVSFAMFRQMQNSMRITSEIRKQIYGWEGYIGTGNSFNINGYLRGAPIEMPEGDFEKTIGCLDLAINNNPPTPVNLRAYRMVDARWLYNNFKELFDKNVEFGQWTTPIKDITSMSKDELVAEMKKFIGTDLEVDKSFNSVSLLTGKNVFAHNREIKLYIDIPKSSKMYVTENTGESEGILPRGSRYNIKEVRKEGIGIAIVLGYLGSEEE